MSKHFVPAEWLHPMVDAMLVSGAGIRADAADTEFVASALTQHAIKAIGTIYPGLMARRIAPVVPGIDPGAKTFTWHRRDVTGMADFIANHANDLPGVDAFTLEEEGKFEGIGAHFSYTTDDIRRAAFARRSGKQASETILGPNKVTIADEMCERKKDYVFAFGDTTRNLPGMLNNDNVSDVDAAAPGSGSVRTWAAGTDKTGPEILEDMLAAVGTVFSQSKGRFMPNFAAMGIDRFFYISTTPLLPTGDNRISILQAFKTAISEMGLGGFQVFPWDKCATADNGSHRAIVGHASSDTFGLVDPLPFTPQPPQPRNLAWIVPGEAKVGGCLIFQPLAFAYVDQC